MSALLKASIGVPLEQSRMAHGALGRRPPQVCRSRRRPVVARARCGAQARARALPDSRGVPALSAGLPDHSKSADVQASGLPAPHSDSLGRLPGA